MPLTPTERLAKIAAIIEHADSEGRCGLLDSAEPLAALLREMLKAPHDHTRIRDERWYAEWLVSRGVRLQKGEG